MSDQNGHNTLPLAEEELGILAASHQHSCFYPTSLTAIEGSLAYQVGSPVNRKYNLSEPANIHCTYMYMRTYM